MDGESRSRSADHSGIDLVELAATVLLGLAGIAIGWNAYQSTLWGGLQDEAYTESVREASNAVDLLQAADTTRGLDQSLFVELLTSGVCDEERTYNEAACELLLASMSDDGAAAVDAWVATNQSSRPFDAAAYVDSLYAPGEQAKLDSQAFFEEASKANEHGDNYELASTVLTTVLFLAGISLVMHSLRTRMALLAGAAVLLIVGIAYSATLPLA